MVHRLITSTRDRTRAGTAYILPVPQRRGQLRNGCGIACCSFIVGYATGNMPDDAAIDTKHGIDCVKAGGTSYAQMRQILVAEIGATVSAVQRMTRQTLIEAMCAGHPVIAGVTMAMGAHAIVVSGLVLPADGGVRLVVNDPAFAMPLLPTINELEVALQMAMVVRL